ncbi:hypothetical protein Hanom_Chr12g01154391 [Helianthus anomalus]
MHYDAAALALNGSNAYDAARHSSNKEETGSSQRAEFMDHDAVFDMPNMLSDMAEGVLLLSPYLGIYTYPPQTDL